MKDLIIIGASGFGREVAWLVERINEERQKWNILGFLDDDEMLQGTSINGYKVIGNSDSVKNYSGAYYVCAIGCSKVREKVISKIKKMNPSIKFATLIDPTAQLSNLVTMGEGVIICANSIVTVNINIGNFVVINLSCTVGHDTVIKDFVTMYPSANISGKTEIGNFAELGTGMQIIQGKKIGDHAFIGAGSVVVSDIPDNCTAVGSPAKIVKHNN